MEGGFFYRRRRFQMWKRNSNVSGLCVMKWLDGFLKIPEEFTTIGLPYNNYSGKVNEQRIVRKEY